jgi:hypothetical protein
MPNKKQAEQVNHDITCLKCGKPATRNIDNTWREWEIDKDGNYSFNPINEWQGDDGYNLCDNCEFDD